MSNLTSLHNTEILDKLTEAINLGGIMARHTAGDDNVLKTSLFKLVDLYKRVKEQDPKLLNSDIESALREFYNIDPEYIELIKNNVQSETTEGNDQTGTREQL